VSRLRATSESNLRLPDRTDSGGAGSWLASHQANRRRDRPGRPTGTRCFGTRSRGSSGPGRRGERSKEDLGGESETHGRIGCTAAGNSGGALRTRRWSKALKSAAPRQARRARRLSNERRIGRRSQVPAQPHHGAVGRRSGSPSLGTERASPETRECQPAAAPGSWVPARSSSGGRVEPPSGGAGARPLGKNPPRRGAAQVQRGASQRGAGRVASAADLSVQRCADA